MKEALWLTELGPYALFILFATYIILKDIGIIKYRKKHFDPDASKCCADKINPKLREFEPVLWDIKKKLDDLYKWHDIVDGDGVRVWYVRKSLEEAIIKLADNIAVQTNILRDLALTVKTIDKDVRDLKE